MEKRFGGLEKGGEMEWGRGGGGGVSTSFDDINDATLLSVQTAEW